MNHNKETYDQLYHQYNVICPYCKYEYHDSWELESVSSLECNSCGMNFHYERIVKIRYNSSADCNLNNKNHDFLSGVESAVSFQCGVCKFLKFKANI